MVPMDREHREAAIPPITTADVDALVGWSLIRAAHRVERDLTVLLAERDLTPVQFGVLATLATAPPRTQAALARAVLVRPQSMAGVVTTMVRRGLVVRAGPGGRGVATPLTLTDRGREVLEQAWPTVAGAHGPERLGGEPDRLGELLAGLHHLIDDPQQDAGAAPATPTAKVGAPRPGDG